jgi:hypothetical protein
MITGVVGLILLAVIVLKVIPFILVRTISPPPEGYVLICRNGKSDGSHSVKSVGLSACVREVKIGGSQRKAHIYVEGLKDVEFIVTQRGDQTIIVDADTGAMKATFDDRTPKQVTTSQGDVVLKVKADQRKLRC